MKGSYPVPSSIPEAEAQFTVGTATTLSSLQKNDFLARWSAIAYLETGLHPDGFESADSGWPEDLKPYAAEAWRRCGLGELSDEQMYCSYSTWAGLCDQLISLNEDESALREYIAQGSF